MGLKNKVRLFYLSLIIICFTIMTFSAIIKKINLLFLFFLFVTIFLLGGGIFESINKRHTNEFLINRYKDINIVARYMRNYVKFLRFRILIGQMFLLTAIITFKIDPENLEDFYTNAYKFKNIVGIITVLIGNVLYYSAEKIFKNIPDKSFMGGVGVYKLSSIVVSIIGFLFILIF